MDKPTVKSLQVICLAFFLIILLFVAQRQIQRLIQSQKTQKHLVAVLKKNQEFPKRLIIPKIHVDAPIESLGLTANGSMDTPKNTIDVGWFKFGFHPGEKGNAVVAGHFDRENGAPGVFGSLDTLKQGDKVYVADTKGNIVTFIVRQSRTYDPGYADDVFRGSDSAHLNLITCNGLWDETKKSYSKRLVVFADIAH